LCASSFKRPAGLPYLVRPNRQFNADAYGAG